LGTRPTPSSWKKTGIRLEGMRKTTKTSIRIAGSRGRQMNLESSKYEAGVLRTRQRCSVSYAYDTHKIINSITLYTQLSKWKFRCAGIIYFLKVKQGYTDRKMGKDKWILYMLISAGIKFRNKKSGTVHRYIPAHFEH
jgi:hypothetical protein